MFIQGTRSIFLPSAPKATFIQGAMLIPDSRVLEQEIPQPNEPAIPSVVAVGFFS